MQELAISTTTCLIQKHGNILIVTLNRPETKNALNAEMLVGMYRAWRLFDEDKSLYCAILTGAGDTFCAGMDLKQPAEDSPESQLIRTLMQEVPDLHWQAMLRHNRPTKPIILAVEGYALAGGTEKALGTDLRVCAEDAFFGIPETQRGLFPLGGSTIRLRRQIPYIVAAEILLLGRKISAQEAKTWSLVNWVVPKGEALKKALVIAEEIAQSAPPSVQAMMKSLRENEECIPEMEGFKKEEALGWAVMATKDAKEGVKAFKEKRQPVFIGE